MSATSALRSLMQAKGAAVRLMAASSAEQSFMPDAANGCLEPKAVALS